MSLLVRLVEWALSTEEGADVVLFQGGGGTGKKATSDADLLSQLGAATAVSVTAEAGARASADAALDAACEHVANKGAGGGYPALNSTGMVEQWSPSRGMIAQAYGTSFIAVGVGAGSAQTNSAAASLSGAGGWYVSHDTAASLGSAAYVCSDVLSTRDRLPEFDLCGRSAILSSSIWWGVGVADPSVATTGTTRSATITNVTYVGSTVTVTTSGAHGLTAGAVVRIGGVSSTGTLAALVNVQATLMSGSGSSFDFTATSGPTGAYTSGGSVVQHPLVNNGGGYSSGVTSMHVDGFTVKPEKGDVFTVAGSTKEYRVTSSGALSGSDSLVTFTPATDAAVADDAVVTLVRRVYTPGVWLYYNGTFGDNLYRLITCSGAPVQISVASSGSSGVFVNGSGVLVRNDGSNTWRADGVKEGMLVTLAGTASNNGTWRVASVNSTGKQLTMTAAMTPEGSSGAVISGTVTLDSPGEEVASTAIPVSANADVRYRVRCVGSYQWTATSWNATTRAFELPTTSVGACTPSGYTSNDEPDKLKAWFALKTLTGTSRILSPRHAFVREAA